MTPCPTCPVCQSLPIMVLGAGRQAFCGNDACPVLTWNPRLPDGGLSDPHFLNITTIEEAPEGHPGMEAVQEWFRNGGC